MVVVVMELHASGEAVVGVGDEDEDRDLDEELCVLDPGDGRSRDG